MIFIPPPVLHDTPKPLITPRANACQEEELFSSGGPESGFAGMHLRDQGAQLCSTAIWFDESSVQCSTHKHEIRRPDTRKPEAKRPWIS